MPETEWDIQDSDSWSCGNAINVMMNGVPYNDSESQGTFFVNVPDLTSSASQILIQRGVGTSNNGSAAFGASINVISKILKRSFILKQMTVTDL
jgi:iron complex outermembrane receptor protein